MKHIGMLILLVVAVFLTGCNENWLIYEPMGSLRSKPAYVYTKGPYSSQVSISSTTTENGFNYSKRYGWDTASINNANYRVGFHGKVGSGFIGAGGYAGQYTVRTLPALHSTMNGYGATMDFELCLHVPGDGFYGGLGYYSRFSRNFGEYEDYRHMMTTANHQIIDEQGVVYDIKCPAHPLICVFFVVGFTDPHYDWDVTIQSGSMYVPYAYDTGDVREERSGDGKAYGSVAVAKKQFGAYLNYMELERDMFEFGVIYRFNLADFIGTNRPTEPHSSTHKVP